MIFFKKKKAATQIDSEYKEFEEIYNFCKSYTMTSVERMYALYKATEYIIKNNIPGDFVECGVWRGGSTLLIIKTLQKFNVTDRKIWLFDTFEGMSAPTNNDKDFSNKSAEILLRQEKKNNESYIWAYATLEDVQTNINLAAYPSNLVNYVKGKVEDTLPQKKYFDSCALLRLDTDWYESTKIELEYLYPSLVTKGVLIIDDYGYWQGCKKAVDEYFEKLNFFPLLQRIDFTGRLFIK